VFSLLFHGNGSQKLHQLAIMDTGVYWLECVALLYIAVLFAAVDHIVFIWIIFI